MKRVYLLTFIILFYTTAGICQQSFDSLNAYAILNKAIEAQGGRAFLQTIKTMYTVTKTRMDGIVVDWTVKEMLPNKAAFQITNRNRVIYQSWFDGNNGFEIVNGKKKKLDIEENKEKFYKRNIINELDYIDAGLWQIKLLGVEKVMNEDCYKIEATLLSGLVKYLYYSKSSFFLLKEEKVLNAERDSFFSFFYFSYKQTGKLTHFTEIKFGEIGKFQEGKLVELVINDLVEEKDFR
ncbi:MAG TPA: hypothetical protein VLR49_13155 [Ferruginibacter sp.]|nr:hypothetical protein [Ferruginibacter sp.]